jgi:serine/threonine protein kinase
MPHWVLAIMGLSTAAACGTHVAIKVLNADSQQGQREFDREVTILGGLHHDHLLPLLGSCSDRHALVYPLMQGSLEQRLSLVVSAVQVDKNRFAAVSAHLRYSQQAA